MAGGISPLLKFLGATASVLVGGFLATAVIAGVVQTTAEKRMVIHPTNLTIHNYCRHNLFPFVQKKISPPCRICEGKGFYPCKLCKGNTTIEWSPLHDPIAINPCICPTCDGNRLSYMLFKIKQNKTKKSFFRFLGILKYLTF